MYISTCSSRHWPWSIRRGNTIPGPERAASARDRCGAGREQPMLRPLADSRWKLTRPRTRDRREARWNLSTRGDTCRGREQIRAFLASPSALPPSTSISRALGANQQCADPTTGAPSRPAAATRTIIRIDRLSLLTLPVSHELSLSHSRPLVRPSHRSYALGRSSCDGTAITPVGTHPRHHQSLVRCLGWDLLVQRHPRLRRSGQLGLLQRRFDLRRAPLLV